MAGSIESLRSAVDDALDRGDADEALRLARESHRKQPDAEGCFLLGAALLAVGDEDEAVDALQAAVALDPDHVDAYVCLADLAIASLDYAAGGLLVATALRVNPVHPVARRLRAGLRERAHDLSGAARDYMTAALADPDAYPMPIALDDETIEAVSESVLEALHPSLRAYLSNVPILVDEFPDDDVLAEIPDAHPFELLGCFTGRAIHERGGDDAWSTLPPTITLYRLNLARLAHDADELERELRITLLHEIGHYLGLDEEDLAERGLD